jgi:hypothetical protein
MGRETCGSGLGKRWRDKNCRQEKWEISDGEWKKKKEKNLKRKKRKMHRTYHVEIRRKMGEKKNNWGSSGRLRPNCLPWWFVTFWIIEESEAADAYVQNHLPSLYRLCPDISSINSSIDYNFLHSEILLSQSYVLRVLRKIVIF